MAKWSIRIQYRERDVLKSLNLVYVDGETKDLMMHLMDDLQKIRGAELLQ